MEKKVEDIKGMWQDNALEPNKRKLLEAALIEFAEKGYERGSTNQIVQNAGVSKGMLFHFFSSKKALYLAIVDACIEYFFSYIQARIDKAPSDFFTRFMHVHQVKMELFALEPSIYRMAVATFIDFPKECQEEIKEREAQFHARYYPLFLEGIDTSMFKEVFAPEKAIYFLLAAVEALTQKYIRENYDADDKGFGQVQAFYEEIERYMDMMKHGLVK